MSSINITPNNDYKISMRANNITSNFGDNFTIDASGSSSFLINTNGFSRARFNNLGLVLEPSGNTITTRQGSNLILDASNSNINFRVNGVNEATINTLGLVMNSGSIITTEQSTNLILDASNSNISFRRNGTERMRITDASSVFLNNVDLSANNLVNVNNILVSRATPQTDASFNFTIVRISTDASARDIALPTPYNGQLCVLLNSSTLQLYNNGSWFSVNQRPQNLTFSVGLTSYVTTTYLTSGGLTSPTPISGGFTIYTIKDTSVIAPGTTRTGTVSPDFTGSITYLVVAGGGSGGPRAGGGGGAGGYRTNFGGSGYAVTANTSYTLTVGAGGSTAGETTIGTSGSNSVFDTITSAGGGYGGSFYSPFLPAAGGSGGGGCDGENSQPTTGANGNTPATVPSQGNNGGAGQIGNLFVGGGGGGAGGVGGDGISTQRGGLGGVGASNSISGSAVFYAGGGGGGNAYIAGTGGAAGGNGGGGAGANGGAPSGTAAVAGTNGLGGGGGGGGYSGGGGTNIGASGGSGVVILRISSYG